MDLVVLPLVLSLSVLPLLWFGRNWAVTPDASSYLLMGWNLVSGEGYTVFGEAYTVRGPVLPGILSGLMLLLGRDPESMAWVVRLLALANPVLMYFLIKRVSGPMAGLLAAAMVTLFCYTATLWHAFNIDAFQLTVYLLAVLVLLLAAQKNSTGLSLLSGLLLGMAILTKETSIVALPLAVFAALRLGWSFRGLLLHYIGVVTICLPWWIWVWTVSGKVYLLGLLSPELAVSVTAALALIALLGVGTYRLGMVARSLTDERRRRLIGRFVVFASTAFLSVLFLRASPEWADHNNLPLRAYVTQFLLDPTPLWYLLPLAGAYVLWETVRDNRLWEFYVASLVLQIPVSLVVLIERWDTRQWLIPQTLLYGALAGLIVKVFGASIRKERHNLHRSLAFGAAAALIIVLVQATVRQALYLKYTDTNLADANGNIINIRGYHGNEANSSVLDMHNWIAGNIPEGEKIIVTSHYSDQLAFLDGMQHEWTVLHMDCAPDTDASANCEVPSKEIAQAPPQPTVQFTMNEDCNGLALSLTTLMQQMERSGSTYLLTTQDYNSINQLYPSNLAWAPSLSGSGAFELVHSGYLPGAPTKEQSYGLVLLKWTGQDPMPAPTQMDARTVNNLVSCEQAARGERYAERIRSNFPNGIETIGSQPDIEAVRPTIEQIYETR